FVGAFIDAGGALIDGLVQGIAAGAGAFVQSLLGIAKSGIATVKGALGISSPSKVFAEIGMHTAGGMAQGVDRGSDGVADASGALAVAAIGGAAAPTASGSASPARRGAGGGDRTFNITINGVKDAEQIKSPSFLAQLAEALEMAAVETGGSPA